MTRAFNLSPDVEELLEPHRKVLPLPPTVEERAWARAAAAAAPEQRQLRPRWLLAAAVLSVVVLGTAAFAGHLWLKSRSAQAPVPPPSGNLHAAQVVAPSLVSQIAPPTPTPEAPAATPALGRPRGPSGKNAELRLLRPARAALSRGDFADALSLTSEHARRFPSGSMVEEREALRVKSLAGLGRGLEAQRAANAFHARFPRSVLLSTFDRMAEPAP